MARGGPCRAGRKMIRMAEKRSIYTDISVLNRAFRQPQQDENHFVCTSSALVFTSAVVYTRGTKSEQSELGLGMVFQMVKHWARPHIRKLCSDSEFCDYDSTPYGCVSGCITCCPARFWMFLGTAIFTKIHLGTTYLSRDYLIWGIFELR